MLTTSRGFAIALVIMLAALPGCGRVDSPADADVKAALEAFYAAMKTGDTTAAMALIAPDALFVESGKLETRAEYEKNHLPADIDFERQITGVRTVDRLTVNGDTAWVVATTSYNGTVDGSAVDFISAQLAVLTRQDNAWRIRSIHWSSRRR